MESCPNCRQNNNLIRCCNLTFDHGVPKRSPHSDEPPVLCCSACLKYFENKCDFCDNIACDGELELCGICQKGICPECQGPDFTDDEEVVCEQCCKLD